MTKQTDFPRLLGDVGGTNVRWAWQPDPASKLTHVRVQLTRDHASIIDSMRSFIHEHALPPPRSAAIGVAAAIASDVVRVTNHPWVFSIDAVRKDLRMERLLVLNDFAALAHAVPALEDGDLRHIGAAKAVEGATIAVIGPGTGLGVSGLVADGRGGWRVIAGEGGHVTLPFGSTREAQVLAALQERFGHASAERAISGPGLVNLYEAICCVDGKAPEALEPTLVVARSDPGMAGHNPACEEAVLIFAGLLGSVAGNLALTLGARGGVFVGGGIVKRLGERLAALPFRQRFEDKGRFRPYMQAIPTSVIVAEHAALIGAARALDALT